MDSLNTNRSFDNNVRNFLAEENSPNCFGKINKFSSKSSAEEEESICTNTSETYTIDSDFEAWNKVSTII